jgi:glucokinase
MRELLIGTIDAKRVALARVRANATSDFEIEHRVDFSCGDSNDFEERFAALVAKAPASEAALAIAGPIEGDMARLTRESFMVSARHLKRQHGFTRVTLLNDFVAVARGAVETPPEFFRELAPGMGDAASAQVVIGPGVGLGMATIRRIGGRWVSLESEGGHQAYAPCDAEEIALLQELTINRHYVTFEDVISETGMVEVYRAFCRMSGETPLLQKFEAIAEAGRTRASRAAALTCEVSARSIATFAGNACLSAGARGGVLIAGSAAMALEPFLASEQFVTRFRRRGSMTLYVSEVPVRLIQDELVTFRGLIAYCLAEASA